jgi:hypothetical protein
MPIEFHCEHCGTLVKAPDNAGGKHGKCPSCHQSVYIPDPSVEIEPLALAPEAESEERERERLFRESWELERRVMEERELPASAQEAPIPTAPDGAFQPPPADVETLLIDYARAMADGDLEQAEKLAAEIRQDMQAADDAIQRIVSDEIPPAELARIPHPVLVGFFKRLQSKK